MALEAAKEEDPNVALLEAAREELRAHVARMEAHAAELTQVQRETAGALCNLTLNEENTVAGARSGVLPGAFPCMRPRVSRPRIGRVWSGCVAM